MFRKAVVYETSVMWFSVIAAIAMRLACVLLEYFLELSFYYTSK